MSHPDSDLMRKAAAALRNERTGHNPGSGFTRARILNDVRAQRKKRSRWWRIGFPVGIILAGTTAWASASGRWPEMLVNVSTLLNMPLTDNGTSERSLATAKTTNSVRSRYADAIEDSPRLDPTRSEELAPVQPLPPESTSLAADMGGPNPPGPTAVGSNALARAHLSAQLALRTPTGRESIQATRSARQSRDDHRVERAAIPPHQVTASASATNVPAPLELEAEIRAFRRADDLYRRSGELEAAIGAYRQYTRDYPTGRFVPEAKYNTALALVKLGRTSEARPLLAPFADGAYGSYRRDAAKKLLQALP